MCSRSDGTMWMATDKGLLHYNGYAADFPACSCTSIQRDILRREPLHGLKIYA